MRSPEFERLFEDIRSGRVNTIVCTSLSRLCRSLRDFLDLLEVLDEHAVEFCSLKEQFDTTTSHGRLISTVLMALAQFEREQTSELTSDSMRARAERGLSNGGRLHGYDLDPDRKGYLLVNRDEAAAVDFLFDAYLEEGTIAGACEALNRAGFRTMAYASRRGVYHAPREFSYTSVQHLLKNPAYIGKKRVGDRLVDAVWPAIVDEEKFWRVQALLAASARSKHAAAKPILYVYVLNGGLLHCACGSAMEGRSGTGRGGVVYFYYVCRNKECGLRVAADEVEGVVLEHLRRMGNDRVLVERLSAETNRRLRQRLPKLRTRRASMEKQRTRVQAEATQRLAEWGSLADEQARSFATEALRALAQQRDDLQAGIVEVDREIEALESAQVSAGAVQTALTSFSDVYECLQPHER